MDTTDDFRGQADSTLNVEAAWNIGKAFADYLPDEGAVVVVEADGANRPTTHALIEGVLLQGRDVVAHSSGDQAVLVAAIAEHEAAGGLLVAHDTQQNLEIITPYDTRGVLMTADTGVAEIRTTAEAGNFAPAATKGTIKSL